MSDALEQMQDLRRRLAHERALLVERLKAIDAVIGPLPAPLVADVSKGMGRPRGGRSEAAREFIRANPGTTSRQIRAATGVDHSCLHRMKDENEFIVAKVGGSLRWRAA